MIISKYIGKFSREIVTIFLTSGTLTLCAGQGIVNLPASIADASAKVEGVKTGLAYSEGPACDRDGNLYFSEMSSPQMNVWKVTPQGVASIFRTSSYFNGIELDPEGRLVFCEQDKITRMTSSGAFETLSKSGDNGFQLLSTNDLSIGSSGALFFTNHSSGKSLFYRSTTGELKRWSSFPTPNGVEWVEEKNMLYLCLSDTSMVMSYSVGADGTISNKQKFASIPIPDGITLDEHYNVYVASYKEGKIYVLDSTGQTLGTITVQGTNNQQGNTSNCVFGGPDNKTLYITGNGGAYKVQLSVAGRTRGGTSIHQIPHQRITPNTSIGVAQKSTKYYGLNGRSTKNVQPEASGVYILKSPGIQNHRSLSLEK